jgi:hypothetical protein
MLSISKIIHYKYFSNQFIEKDSSYELKTSFGV